MSYVPFNLLPSSSCFWYLLNLHKISCIFHIPSLPFHPHPYLSCLQADMAAPAGGCFSTESSLDIVAILEDNRKKSRSTWICLTNGWGKNAIDVSVCSKLCFWGNLVAFSLVEIQFHLGGTAHSMAVNYNSSIWTKQIWKTISTKSPLSVAHLIWHHYNSP